MQSSSPFQGGKGLLIRQKHLYSILKTYFFFPYSSLKRPEGWDSATQRTTKFNFMLTQFCTRILGDMEVPIAGSAAARSPSDQTHATSSFPNVPPKNKRGACAERTNFTIPAAVGSPDLQVSKPRCQCSSTQTPHPQRPLTPPSATKGLCEGLGGSSSSYSSA